MEELHEHELNTMESLAYHADLYRKGEISFEFLKSQVEILFDSEEEKEKYLSNLEG